MKTLYLLLLLIMFSTPLSRANQTVMAKHPTETGNIVVLLQQIDQDLALGQMQQLTASWAKIEGEWQKLFANAPTQKMNKIYNQLQVSYLVFQQQQHVGAFRQELNIALRGLR